MFGKPFSAYVRFAGASLAIIAGVALLRLVLSLAGVSNAATKWLSATVVLLVCVVVWSARVYTTGFGSYKQILPVVWLQSMTLNVVVIAGILLAMATGQDNIFTAREYSGGGDGKVWGHVIGHVVFGAVAGPLVAWGLGSLVMLVTKKVSRGPDQQRAAA